MKQEVVKIGNMPSNSHSSKKERQRTAEKKNKQVSKVVKGRVKKERKSLGKQFTETFLGENLKNVGEYLFKDVLIPTLQDTVSDLITGGTQMLIYGEDRKKTNSRGRSGSKSHFNYGSYFSSDRSSSKRREVSRRTRSRHEFEDIMLEKRSDCEAILNEMDRTIDEWGEVSVADLYNMLDVSSDPTDHKFGWTDLEDADYKKVRNGWILLLPKTEVL